MKPNAALVKTFNLYLGQWRALLSWDLLEVRMAKNEDMQIAASTFTYRVSRPLIGVNKSLAIVDNLLPLKSLQKSVTTVRSSEKNKQQLKFYFVANTGRWYPTFVTCTHTNTNTPIYTIIHTHMHTHNHQFDWWRAMLPESVCMLHNSFTRPLD